MGRKTVNVTTMLNWANNYLAESFNDDVSKREGVMIMIESMLHETNNYRGFGYLEKREVPVGNTFGINDHEYDTPTEEMFRDTDKTRVKYYPAH